MITKDLFFSFDNPIIFSFILAITLGVLIYLFYVNIYRPLQKQHQLEKEVLELKNSRLMAMFAELDPEPLFRFNNKGEVIFTNESGSLILDSMGVKNAIVTDIFPVSESLNYENFITRGNTYLSTVRIGDEFYDVTMKGIPEAGFGQIYCNDITIRKNTEEELNSSRQKLRELSNHILKVQESEKKKISRELHDNFGQILTSIKMTLELLREKNNNNFKNDFNELNLKLDEARKEIRELSYRLRPRVLDDFGLSPALKMLTEDISRSANMKGIYQAHNFSQRLEPEIETNIYRIVQEALNNIVKHSRASEFNVQITKHEEKIVVSVEDNGVGFDFGGIKKADLKSGMGIINMQERIVALDGNLSVNSKLGGGTEILIEIPLEEQNG